MTLARAFESFLAALSAEEDTDYVRQIERAFGITCSDAARQLLSRTNIERGSGHFFTAGERAYSGENMFVDLLRRPMHLLGAIIGAVPLGDDGAGRTYFLQVGEREEIGLYDPGLGELAFLADSPEAFAALNHAWALFDAFATEHDVNVEALIDGGASLDRSRPDLAELSSILEALGPRVLLSDELDVMSDFTETFCALAGPFDAESQSSMSADTTRIWWLSQVFAQRGLGPADIQAAVPVDESRKKVSDALYTLWHTFFLRDEVALSALTQSFKEHPAALVRDAASFVDALVDGRFSHFGYLLAARDLAHESLMAKAISPVPTAKHALLLEDYEDEATQEIVQQLQKKPGLANQWDQLAFRLYAKEQWPEMLAAAKASIAIQPLSYYPWMQFGIAMSQLENHESALRAFDVALAIEGNNANLWFNKAGSLLELGRHDEAIAHLELTPPQGRRETILAMGDFEVLDGNTRYDALMQAP